MSHTFILLIFSSGISEEEMDELKKLLTSVAKLQDVKPSTSMKKLYSKSERNEAEIVRNEALKEVDDEDLSSCDESEILVVKNSDENNNGKEDEQEEDSFVTPKRPRMTHHKKDLIQFLESKSEVHSIIQKC